MTTPRRSVTWLEQPLGLSHHQR